jgi:Fe-S cluster biogenesis protein NfuA
MAPATRQQLLALCRDVLAPLVEADKGRLYIVSAADDELTLHLGGNCSGCPGAPLTIRTLIEPAVRDLYPDVRLVVTVGAKRPPTAVEVKAVDDGTA